MRTIKFRAWDNKNKVMINPFCELRENLFWGEDLTNTGLTIPISVMQFTGLFDKNGVEIYEGDILSTETLKHMQVGWNNRFSSFSLTHKDWAFSHWFGESCEPEQCLVVGNIFENPELLQ